MKKRIAKSALFVGLFLVFGFSTFAQILSPSLGTSKASAASTYDYVFSTGFSPNDQEKLKSFKDAIKGNDEGSSIFVGTFVGVKGGVFNNKAFRLSYDQGKTGCAQASKASGGACSGTTGDHFGGQDKTLYVYSGEYMCRNGNVIGAATDKAYYTIRYSVSVNLGGSSGAFDGDTLKNNTRLHWVGFGSNNTAGATFYPDKTSNTVRRGEDIEIKKIPKSCLPPGVPSSLAGLSDKNSEERSQGTVNKYMPILERASEDIKKAWKEAGIDEAANTGSVGEEDAVDIGCTYSSNPLTWVVCPVIDGFSGMINGLDNMITSQLSVGSPGNSDNPSQIFCDRNSTDLKQCDAYHSAWVGFRNIALGVLLIMGLAAIISEMAGFEFFDAYTLRKMLPRLVVAALALTLSWQLMDFFVQFSNALGYGVRYLIYQPFVAAGFDQATIGGGGATAILFLGIITGGALGIFGLLSLAATGALAVLVAFLTLMIRELVIISLVIIAPVAIVLYIMPNTEKYYKMWWETFAKALMMFPMIAAMIAAGRVFAAVVTTGAENDPFRQILGFAAYFAPYFMIPMTFKYAGSAMAAIGGAIDQRAGGMRQGLQKYRGAKQAENWQGFKDGNRFKGSNRFSRAFNKASLGVSNVPTAGVVPWKMKGRYAAGMTQHSMHLMSDYMEKSEAFKAMSANDDYLQATMENMGGGHNESDWRRYLQAQGYTGDDLERGVALIRAAKRDTNDHTFHQAAVAANFSTGTGWKEGGAGQMMESVNEVVGDDRDMGARILAQGRSAAKQAGRIDLGGAGFGGQMGNMEAMYRGALSAQEATRLNNEAVLKVNGPGQLAHARGDAMKQLAPAIADNIRRAYASGNPTTAKRELAKAAGVYDAMAQAAPENAEYFADAVLEQPLGQDFLRADGTPRTLRTEIEDSRSDPEFLAMRREYSSERDARRANGGQEPPEGGGAPGIPGS